MMELRTVTDFRQVTPRFAPAYKEKWPFPVNVQSVSPVDYVVIVD
jgi:hypothetical protein